MRAGAADDARLEQRGTHLVIIACELARLRRGAHRMAKMRTAIPHQRGEGLDCGVDALVALGRHQKQEIPIGIGAEFGASIAADRDHINRRCDLVRHLAPQIDQQFVDRAADRFDDLASAALRVEQAVGSGHDALAPLFDIFPQIDIRHVARLPRNGHSQAAKKPRA